MHFDRQGRSIEKNRSRYSGSTIIINEIYLGSKSFLSPLCFCNALDYRPDVVWCEVISHGL